MCLWAWFFFGQSHSGKQKEKPELGFSAGFYWRIDLHSSTSLTSHSVPCKYWHAASCSQAICIFLLSGNLIFVISCQEMHQIFFFFNLCSNVFQNYWWNDWIIVGFAGSLLLDCWKWHCAHLSNIATDEDNQLLH